MIWPKISVVIPSFNQGRFILRTIRSIQLQDYPGQVEIIVSDGGSTDETVDVLKSLQGITWWSAKDRGFADAVNKGFKVATGDIFAIQSSDDYYLQGVFRKAMLELDKHPGCVLVSGAELQINLEKKVVLVQEQRAGLVKTPRPLTTGLLYLPQHCTFFRAAAFRKIGGARESVDWCADFDLFYRLLHLGPGKTVSDFYGVYQLHPAQRTQSHAARYVSSGIKTIEDAENETQLGKSFRLTPDEKEAFAARLNLFWHPYVDAVNGPKFAHDYATKVLTQKGCSAKARALARTWLAQRHFQAAASKSRLTRIAGSIKRHGFAPTFKVLSDKAGGLTKSILKTRRDHLDLDLNWWSASQQSPAGSR